MTNESTRWVVAALVTGTFGAILIQQSLIKGALALPPTYDDVSYFNDGAEYLYRFYEEGFRAVISDFIRNPPHAPLSTSLAFLSYIVTGVKNLAGAAASVVVVFLFSVAFLAVAKPLPLAQATLLLIALLGSPFIGLTVLWFRPDMICSLLIGTGMMLIVLRTEWLERVRDQMIAGLLLGAALWSKPTVFHLTGALFGAAMCLASLQSFVVRDFRKPVLAIFVTTGTGVLVSLPYYLLTFERVITYIWTTVYGSEASIWVQPLPLADHVLFYLTGYYGKISLGQWLFGGALVGGAALTAIWLEGDRKLLGRSLLGLAVVLLTYLAVTIPAFKGPHGFPFAATFMVGVAAACITLAHRLPRPAGWVFCIGLVAFSGWQWEWPFARSHFVVTSDYATTRWEMLRQAYAAIGDRAQGKNLVLTTSANYLNYYTLKFEFLSHGRTPPTVLDLQRIDNLEAHRRAMSAADFVLALSPDMMETIPNLPTSSPQLRAKLITAIEETNLFEPAIRIPDMQQGGAVLLYRLRPDPLFTNFVDEQNIGPVSGPYPEWNLPQIRWGTGSATVLVVRGVPDSAAKLLIQARAFRANQTLTVRVNGELKDKFPVTGSFEGHQIQLNFDITGQARIELLYGIPAKNAVLFKALALR